MVVLPASKDYGALDEGASSAAASFTMQNTGAATAAVAASITGPDQAEFSIDADGCSGFAWPNLGMCSISVSFHPQGAGARSATLLITDGIRQGTVALSGHAVGLDSRPCAGPDDCQSANCTDGFCCDNPAVSCEGCYACNIPGAEGTCSPVPAGADPHGVCAGLACATGTCDGNGTCGAGMAGSVCATDGCANNPPHMINHVCTGTTTGCPATTTDEPCPGGYLCTSATACGTSCASDADCASGYWCNGSSCTPSVTPPGGSCTRTRQCAYSDVCSGGLCRSCVLGTTPSGWPFVNWLSAEQICMPTSDGANRTGYCSDEASPNAACAAAGVGSYCAAPSAGAKGACWCTSNADCTQPSSPHCLPNVSGAASGAVCGCWVADQGSPTGVFPCPAGKVCVASVPNNYQASCKSISGYPCSAGSECLTGTCSNGACL